MSPPLRSAVLFLLAATAGLFLADRRGLLPWQSGSQQEEFALPPDFAVPEDFAGAVTALERLTGATARPLVVMDSLGDSVVTRGMEVDVHWTLVESLVEVSQPHFLARGFYLFHAEQHFGIGNQPDRVALYPSADPYQVVRLMGTNGWNYDISPDSIERWLRALAPQEPFVLTGLGFDWLAGRFTGPLRDPRDLAERLYAFCPDIVDQGTGSVRALARELRRNRTLYCWWD